ncbi:hypothetical protein [Halorubrum vacuolatum]|uniref:DUF2306 domain-containing protein n=1 Tax=Halorubrum vacuolatum TaxID=63740 RepID=A0A238YIM1_HALVU|nr:hypothetical protein [Halorubrum vacuolatum]SNR70648.1 hypothetical protein SAMN06264855_1463 [Halorubrum vacuolatum]
MSISDVGCSVLIERSEFSQPLFFEASGDSAIADPMLWIHILAGAIALLAGLAAIVTVKGGHRHNLAGRVYGTTMGIVVVTSFPLAIWADNWFLFAIAVFTGYLITAGYRVITRRRAGMTKPTRSDYLLQFTMLTASVGMIAGGGYGAVTGVMELGEVLVVFGGIGGILAARELYQYRVPLAEQTPWFERHIAFMGGGYIATVTAVVTVNLTMLPDLLRWLGPTLVGVPLIFLAIRKYRPRFGGKTA